MNVGYIPNTYDDRRRMLEFIGIEDISILFQQIPNKLLLERELNIPQPLSEPELTRYITDLAEKNANLNQHICFLGAGVYDHYIPSTVPAVLSRSEFYTSYTPYQPELSQGNLQATFEFQTLICRLTKMDVANASMYDGATALAEAALMCSSITGRSEWLVSNCVHPVYREVLKAYAWASGNKVIDTGRIGISTEPRQFGKYITSDTACVIIQHPNFFGALEPAMDIGKLAHEAGALFVICFDPISLGLLKPPGELGADICVAEGQPLGIPMNYGGPLLGLFACRREFVRQIPGRLVGMTTDKHGRRGYVLTLQTREQHIRRERATSNICTNEALCALAASVYLSTLGKQGLQHVANLCLQKAHYAAKEIASLPGYEIPFDARFFKEFVVRTSLPVSEINRYLLTKNIIGGLNLERFYPDLGNCMLLCVTEKRTAKEIRRLVEVLKECTKK
jgi:glycine dehydrogenase subunit 1